jgi:transcriptional regulator with XRE-family HTH domain
MVGDWIRQWRVHRRMSQLALATESNISTRHLSYLENGRARPGVATLLAIAQCLGVPLRERNRWLVQSGYAPRYAESKLDSPSLQPAIVAVRRVLEAHDPYPGVAMDRSWNLVMANRAASGLLQLVKPEMREGSINLFRLGLHPDGLAGKTSNFEQWGAYMLRALRRLVEQHRDDSLAALLAEVSLYPNVKALSAATQLPSAPSTDLLIPFCLRWGEQELAFFTMLSSFGTPQDITLEELSLELFYPADAATAQALHKPSDQPVH